MCVCILCVWVLALLYLHAVCHIRWQRFLPVFFKRKIFFRQQKKKSYLPRVPFGRVTRVVYVMCAAQLKYIGKTEAGAGLARLDSRRSHLNRSSAMGSRAGTQSARLAQVGRWVAALASLWLWQLRQRPVKHTQLQSSRCRCRSQHRSRSRCVE